MKSTTLFLILVSLFSLTTYADTSQLSVRDYAYTPFWRVTLAPTYYQSSLEGTHQAFKPNLYAYLGYRPSSSYQIFAQVSSNRLVNNVLNIDELSVSRQDENQSLSLGVLGTAMGYLSEAVNDLSLSHAVVPSTGVSYLSSRGMATTIWGARYGANYIFNPEWSVAGNITYGQAKSTSKEAKTLFSSLLKEDVVPEGSANLGDSSSIELHLGHSINEFKYNFKTLAYEFINEKPKTLTAQTLAWKHYGDSWDLITEAFYDEFEITTSSSHSTKTMNSLGYSIHLNKYFLNRASLFTGYNSMTFDQSDPDGKKFDQRTKKQYSRHYRYSKAVYAGVRYYLHPDLMVAAEHRLIKGVDSNYNFLSKNQTVRDELDTSFWHLTVFSLIYTWSK